MKKSRIHNYAGFSGFFGFLGFLYFYNHSLSSLFFFAFFAFFANFFLPTQLEAAVPDERQKDHMHKAGYSAFYVAISALLLLTIVIAVFEISRQAILLFAVISFIASYFTFALLFRHYEKVS